MTLTTLFVSLCLKTTALPCEDIQFHVGKTAHGSSAMAQVLSDGSYRVTLSPYAVRKGDYYIKTAIIHELAHLTRFALTPDRPDCQHDFKWKLSCKSLSTKAGIGSLHCTED